MVPMGTPNNFFQGLLQVMGGADAKPQGLMSMFGAGPAQASEPPAPAPVTAAMPPLMNPQIPPSGGLPMPGLADLFKETMAPGSSAAPLPQFGAGMNLSPAPATEILPWKIPPPEQKPADGGEDGDVNLANVLRAAFMGAGGGRGRSIGGAFASGLSGGAKAIDAIEKGEKVEARQKKLDAERAEDRSYRRGRDSKLDGLRAERQAREEKLADIKMRQAEIQLKDAEKKLKNGEQLTINETLRLAELDKDLAESTRKRFELDDGVDVSEEIDKERQRLFERYPRLRSLLQTGGSTQQQPAPAQSGAAADPAASKPAYDRQGRAVYNRGGQWVYEDGTPYQPAQ